MTRLPSQIADLSVTEKYELQDALWQDIESHSPALSDEQSAELDRRIAKYEQYPSAVIPWEQVRADLFKR
jgi:putative addiction module component (TIGR02574 family)